MEEKKSSLFLAKCSCGCGKELNIVVGDIVQVPKEGGGFLAYDRGCWRKVQLRLTETEEMTESDVD